MSMSIWRASLGKRPLSCLLSSPKIRTFSSRPTEDIQQKKDLESKSAKYLVSLNKTRLDEPIAKEDADKEAQDWISAIQQMREEFKQEGYSPSKMFAPPGATDFEFFRDAGKSQTGGLLGDKFEPTQEQLRQLELLKEKAIPARNDKTIDYLTNVIMRKGFKARAQKYMSQALYLVHLKTRKDPVELLKDVLERMGPVVKLKRYSDGGARTEMVPVPLSEKQRIRQSWQWILESCKKRPSKDFSVRLAEEIIAASSGNSPGFEKKVQQHKLAIVNRSYISMMRR